jgi:hypothetical protein
MRNSIRSYYLDLDQEISRVLLSHEVTEDGPSSSGDPCDIIIHRGDGGTQKISSSLNIGIVEKSLTSNRTVTIFFVAGQRADSTWGAAEYLARNWKKLEREFGALPFVVGLGFPKVDHYPKEYLEPEVLVKLVL